MKSYYESSLFVIRNGIPEELKLYVGTKTEDVLEEVFQAILSDPEPILSCRGPVALMVHNGRTVVLLQPSSNCLTISSRFGAARVSMAKLSEKVDYVAELIDGRVEAYAV